MKIILPMIVAAALVAVAVPSCKREKTVAERAEDAANQAKLQTDISTHAAIDEARRIAAETGRPVDVKVTQRVDVDPTRPIAPPPPPGYVVPPNPNVVIEPVEPDRTPGQAIDNALQKAGQKLQQLGERIEDKAER